MRVTYREPGQGAIDYATELLRAEGNSTTWGTVRSIIADLPDEKRVKRCDYCGYPWRDGSLRNRKHTCSDECKTGIKTLQRAAQRADKALLSGKKKKKTKRDENYIWWLEYPFWLDEYEMLKQSWKHEVSKEMETIDYIAANIETLGKGNRRIRDHSPGHEDRKMGKAYRKRERADNR